MKPRLDYNSLSHSPRKSCTSNITASTMLYWFLFFVCLFLCVSLPLDWKLLQKTSTVNLVQYPIPVSHLEIRCMSSLRKPVFDHLTPPSGSPSFFFTYHFFRYFLVYLNVYLELVSPLEYGPQELRLFLPCPSLYLHCLEKCLDIEGL